MPGDRRRSRYRRGLAGAFMDRWDRLQGEHFYFSQQAYAQSKLANLLFVYELARRLEGSGVTVNVVNPGLVHTNICMDSGWLIGTAKRMMDRFSGMSPEEGT